MKKLTYIILIICVFVIFPCLVLYHSGATLFLDKFLNEQMIPLMGTIMALNFASATALHAVLLDIEEKYEKDIFLQTKKEIRQNLIFMISTFIIMFIIQMVDIVNKNIFLYTLVGIKLLLFFLYFYAIYDLNNALFSISKKN